MKFAAKLEILAIVLAAFGLAGAKKTTSYPFQKRDILALLKLDKGTVDPGTLAALIRKDGIAFEPSDSFMQSVRGAGAPRGVVKALQHAKRVKQAAGREEPPGGAIYPGEQASSQHAFTVKLVSGVHPVYPQLARIWHIQGKVHLWIVIGPRGTVEDIKEVSKPLGHGLDESAIEAVSNWRYSPPVRDGLPVEVRSMVSITYTLGR